MTTIPVLDGPALTTARGRLLDAGYTVDAAAALLADADVLDGRSPDDPLAVLLRLFVLAEPVPATAVAPVLGDLDPWLRGGLLARSPDGPGDVAALVDLRPHGSEQLDGYVVSDLDGTRPLRPDHVVGVSAAAMTLAGLTVRLPVDRALDLGTGCGVQALHLSGHAGAVVASDVNPRSLALARLTAGLSGVAFPDLRLGDRYAPVAGERFDLVVSNPPFVAGPGRVGFSYRDGGLAGDAMSASVVSGAADHLAPGGVAQLLANWLHVRGQDWRERVTGWLPPGCDAWVVQREVQDPADYVALWLRDAGEDVAPDAARRAADWLDWFSAHDVTAVGFGWVTLRATGTPAVPHVELTDLRQAVEQPVWRAVADRLAAVDALRLLPDADLLDLPLRPAAGLEVLPGPRLRQSRGLRLEAGTDPVGLAVVAGCDGARPLRQALLGAAEQHGLPSRTLVAGPAAEGALAAVRGLVEQGFLLLPVPPSGQPWGRLTV